MQEYTGNILVKIKLEKDIMVQFDLLKKLKELPPLSIIEETKGYSKLLHLLIRDMEFIKENLYKINAKIIEKKVHTKIKNIEEFEGVVSNLEIYSDLTGMLKDDKVLSDNLDTKDNQMTKKDRLNIEAGALSMVLNTFPRGGDGLVSDETRNSEKYRKVKRLFEEANKASREENKKSIGDKSRGKVPIIERMAKVKEMKALEEERYQELIEELDIQLTT